MHGAQLEPASPAVELEDAEIGHHRVEAAECGTPPPAACPGAVTKSTLGTNTRRLCSVRNRMSRLATKARMPLARPPGSRTVGRS